MPFPQAHDPRPSAPAFDPVIALIDDDPLHVDDLAGLLAMEGLTRVRGVDARRPIFPALDAIEADCLVIDDDPPSANGWSGRRARAERTGGRSA